MEGRIQFGTASVRPRVHHARRVRRSTAGRIDTDRGSVTRFVVQLEYRIDDGWYEVVRFDHDPDSEHGHDVANEGVHVDVYRDEKRIRSEEIFPPMTPDNAFTFAEEQLSRARQTLHPEAREMARDREPMTDAE